jgi:streptogramin lyase
VASQNGNSAYAAATPVTNPFTISPKAANYMVTTFAGQTNYGFTNAQGTNAAFMSPHGVALDRYENLYVADAGNNMIRKIDTNGNVTTVAGSTTSGSQNGQGTNARFSGPSGVAVDTTGNLYVADQNNNMIRKIDTNGNVITLAGNNAITNAQGWSGGYADGIGTNARFAGPSGVAVDGSGNVYVADQDNNMIRKIDTNGNVTTWAGNNTLTNQWGPIGGYTNGIGTNALFSGPIGVAVDGSGNVYVADKYNSAIRRIDTNDVVTTVIADSSVFYGPMGVAVDGSGNLFVTDSDGNAIREISATGVLTTLAGGSYGLGMQNGLGTNATFSGPTGIAVDAVGHIYVGDIFNNAIRLMTPQ